MKLVVATNNAHKLVEFKRILEPFGFQVVGQKEIEINIEVPETGDTFAENSLLKATAIHKACGMAVVADDSGLCVPALGGDPGVYSARYGGDACKDDSDRTNLLLANMTDVPDDKREGYFVSAISLVFTADDIIQCEGRCYGKIGYAPVGENGFGYDPVFMVGERSFAQHSGEEKDLLSHRGKALEILRDELEKRNS